MGVFSIFTGKKKINNETKTHYKRYATAFMLTKYLCLILALVMLLYGFTFLTEEISMDNFRYLLSFITSDEKDVSEYNTIYYDNDANNDFALVRGDLAVVNSGGSAVYSMSGKRRSVDTTLRMDHPMTLSSAKQFFVFDIGGTELVVKSSLETVTRLNFEYPIWAVDVAQNGVYAVASAEKDSRSTVFVYDEKNREFYKCAHGSLYTVSVALNDSAEKLLVASVKSENGDFISTVRMYSLNKEAVELELNVAGEYPQKISFRKGGGFILMTNKSCRFYDKNNGLVSQVIYGTEGISSFYLNENGFVRESSGNSLSATETLRYYNTDGTVLFEKSFDNGVKHSLENGGFLFAVSGESLYVIRLSDGEIRDCPVPSDTLETMPVEDGKTLVLTKGSAYALDYSALFADTEVSE